MINQVQTQPTLDTRLPTQPLTNHNLWFLNDEFICLPLSTFDIYCATFVSQVLEPRGRQRHDATWREANLAKTAIKIILKVIRISDKY